MKTFPFIYLLHFKNNRNCIMPPCVHFHLFINPTLPNPKVHCWNHDNTKLFPYIFPVPFLCFILIAIKMRWEVYHNFYYKVLLKPNSNWSIQSVFPLIIFLMATKFCRVLPSPHTPSHSKMFQFVGHLSGYFDLIEIHWC